jgi:hypothetical protein
MSSGEVRSRSARWFEETPSGAANGVNMAFTLTYTPSPDTLRIRLGGATQVLGVDYTHSGTAVTFTSAPFAGDTIRAAYMR